MTIKINVGVNKKIGLPNFGSVGSHCNIEIEADNSVLQDTELFLQRVNNAYELARQSVDTELDHHRTGNASPARKEPAQEQRQEYRSDNSGSTYIASAKQQQFIAALTKKNKLDWRKVNKFCDVNFGKSCSQLSPKEASSLIEVLKNGGREVIAV